LDFQGAAKKNWVGVVWLVLDERERERESEAGMRVVAGGCVIRRVGLYALFGMLLA
jgi:hypothetical protein